MLRTLVAGRRSVASVAKSNKMRTVSVRVSQYLKIFPHLLLLKNAMEGQNNSNWAFFLWCVLQRASVALSTRQVWAQQSRLYADDHHAHSEPNYFPDDQTVAPVRCFENASAPQIDSCFKFLTGMLFAWNRMERKSSLALRSDNTTPSRTLGSLSRFALASLLEGSAPEPLAVPFRSPKTLQPYQTPYFVLHFVSFIQYICFYTLAKRNTGSKIFFCHPSHRISDLQYSNVLFTVGSCI